MARKKVSDVLGYRDNRLLGFPTEGIENPMKDEVRVSVAGELEAIFPLSRTTELFINSEGLLGEYLVGVRHKETGEVIEKCSLPASSLYQRLFLKKD